MSRRTQQEIRDMHNAITTGLNMRIPTFEILRRYEEMYDEISPYLTETQNFNIQSQFARHENFLSESTGLTLRPDQEQMRRQAQVALNIAHSRPRSTEDADPFNLGPPTVAGSVTQKRKRSKSEEDLMANETLDWSDFDASPGPPPGPGGGGGPPPPPMGGAPIAI